MATEARMGTIVGARTDSDQYGLHLLIIDVLFDQHPYGTQGYVRLLPFDAEGQVVRGILSVFACSQLSDLVGLSCQVRYLGTFILAMGDAAGVQWTDGPGTTAYFEVVREARRKARQPRPENDW